MPISRVAELAGLPAEAVPNSSYISGAAAASGGPPSGCATPTAISEAGARFADATLSPPDETRVRADADNGAASSQVRCFILTVGFHLHPVQLAQHISLLRLRIIIQAGL